MVPSVVASRALLQPPLVALCSAAALLLSGCRETAPEPPLELQVESQPESQPVIDEPTPAAAEVDVAAPPVSVGGELDAPQIEFQPVGLSPLYEGFMADPGAISVLRRGLAGRLKASVVALKVVWDQRTVSATITLHMPERDKRFEPLSQAVAAGGEVSMGQVQPLLAALAAYRADLAARLDLRFLSFALRLSWWDPHSSSHCTLRELDGDLDGTQLAECFECSAVGEESLRMCRTGESWPATLSGSERARKILSSALRSSL